MTFPVRSTLEVLKFSSASDVLRSFSLLNSHWSRLAISPELWNALSKEYKAIPQYSLTTLTGIAKYRYLMVVSVQESLPILEIDGKISGFSPYLNRFVVKRQNLPIKCVDILSVAVILPENNGFFVCGGRKSTHSYQISLKSVKSTVIRHPNLLQTRTFHSAIFITPDIYVFGGEHKTVLKSAEKYRFSDRIWSFLPEMHSNRCSFNAVYWEKRVFLCGGISTTCETYDPEKNQFSLLKFRLSESNWTTTFVFEGKMVVLVGNYFYFFRENRNFDGEKRDFSGEKADFSGEKEKGAMSFTV